MAFRFNWPEFDTEFYDEAKAQLETALNKGNKPKNIVDHITVKELHMGTQPPELEILEIGELTTDKFRGIFKLTYAGDAYIVLQTKVQANPMHAKQSALPRHTRPNILAADHPLVVPMLLRISDLKLRGIVVLVVSKTKGITLVFKNDPLENILISSTFDSVTSVRNFLQREIEKQLRNLFQEDLPVMIHNLSLRHIQSEQEKAKKQQQEARLKAQQLRKLERKHRHGSGNDPSNGGGAMSSSPTMSVFSDPGLRQRQTLQQHQPFSSRPGSFIFPHPSLLAETSSMPDLSNNLSSPHDQLQQPRPITPSVHLSDISFPFIEDPAAFLDNARFATLYRPGSGVYSSFSDLYHASEQPASALKSPPLLPMSPPSTYGHSAKTPVTAANLSTLDLLYHQHRLASSQLSGSAHGSPPRPPPDISIAPKTIPDVFSDDDYDEHGLYANYEYDDDERYHDFDSIHQHHSNDQQQQYHGSPSPSSSSAIATSSIYDMYSEDVDAPWYVTEGLGLPVQDDDNDAKMAQQLVLPADQTIVLDPFENAGAAKLAQLSKNHHTISPFTHAIDHVTYRSHPHAVKPAIRPKHKKIPKRRIIRLNLSSVSSTAD